MIEKKEVSFKDKNPAVVQPAVDTSAALRNQKEETKKIKNLIRSAYNR